MCVTIAVCVVLSSVICSAVPNLDVMSNGRDSNDGGAGIADVFGSWLSEEDINSNGEIHKEISYTADHANYPTKRRKRTASLIARGALALRALLTGTKPVYSSGNTCYRNYEKQGDYVTAMKDFLSVNPVRIEEKTSRAGVKATTGLVGDRRLIVKSHGVKRGPTLEIIDKTGKFVKQDQQYVDRIFYKTIRQ